MDFAVIIKPIVDFIVYYWSLSFFFYGYEITIGSVILFVALVGLVVWFLKGLID